MSQAGSDRTEPMEYGRIGLANNPFGDSDRAALAGDVAARATANRLLAEFRDIGAKRDGRPLWIETDPSIPSSYVRKALGTVLHEVAVDETLGVMLAYVPFVMVRNGRVRSVLSVVAERVGGPTFDLTLAHYLRDALTEPDQGIIDRMTSPVDPETIATFRERLESEPSGALEELYGECVSSRDTVEDAKLLIALTDRETGDLPADPEESQESDDTESEPFSVVAQEALSGDHADGDGDEGMEMPVADPLVEYIDTHLREHLSPVIARAVRAYAIHGLDVMVQEFKRTRAPRKTLKALARLATHRYGAVIVMYDQFEQWSLVPPELRIRIVATLSEMRWMMAPELSIAIMSAPQATPEIEETFGGARRCSFGFPELPELQKGEAPSEDTVRALFAAAALGDDSVDEDVIDEVLGLLGTWTDFATFAKNAAARVEARVTASQSKDA